MYTTKKIIFKLGEDFFEFRSLNVNDVSQNYIDSLKLERKYISANPEDISICWQKEYIRKINNSFTNLICGLFLNEELIGTVGAQNINDKNNTTIGIFVLSKNMRGIGLGKALVWAGTCFLKKYLNTIRLEAGMLKDNLPSLKAFLSCGFKKKFEDLVIYKVEILAEKIKTPHHISKVEFIEK